MKCPECQLSIPEDSNFCNACGCHLEEASDTSEIYPSAAGERKHVTIMFSDLSGYTAMAERLDPEDVKEIMSLIFGKITEIIQSYDGFIEKFIGDAVMAVFGVPKVHEDDPVRAIRSAIEIHAAIEGFSPRIEGKIGRSLSLHTGINTGLVVTGEVDVEKGVHGLTGDSINLASRLEGIAGAGEIIVGPDTYQQAIRYFEFETLEPTQVKGKTEPVAVYKLVSVMDQQDSSGRLHGVQAKLIGRDAEMNILMEAVENLKQRKGSIISVSGHAGTGKSRLIQEFKARLAPNEVQWREGHAYAYTQSMAYYPLTNLLTHAFQIREEDRPDQIRAKIEAGVDDLLWDKPEAKKYLGSLFSLHYAEIEEVSPEFWRGQLHRSVQDILEAVAGRGPTVMLFEDLHWADASFIELLHLLLQNTHRPILFVCVYRPPFTLFPGGEPDSLAWPHYKILLKELSWDETGAMLLSLLNATHLPDELRYFIKQKAEGNPFYLEEVINTLIETGTLIADNGGWKLAQSLEQVDIPTTVQGVLASRLDRLEKQAKRILQEASVIGRAFFYKVLTRITNLTAPVDQYLSGLESLDLIRTRKMEPDLEYVFKHALTQEVVYNGLLIKERQAIHERIGTAIEQIFADRLPEFYETLAFHYKRGQSVHKSVDYLVKSGVKNLNRYALEEAHQYFQESFELLVQKPDRSREEDRLLIDTLIKWAYVFYYYGKYRDLVDLLKANITIAEALDGKEQLGMYYAWLGYMLTGSEEYKDADRYLLKALELGEETGSLEVKGYALTWLTWNCTEQGRIEEAITYGKAAQKIASSLAVDRYLYFKSLAGIGHANYYAGKSVENIDIGGKLLDYGDKHSDIRCMSLGYVTAGHGYATSGDFPMAIEQYQKAVSVSVDPMYSHYAMLFLGIAYAQKGQFNKAQPVLDDVVTYCRDGQFQTLRSPAAIFLGVAKVANGDMSDGFKNMENIRNRWVEKERGALHYLFDFLAGTIYLQMAIRAEPVRFQTIINNIGFIIKNVPFAAKKAEFHLKRATQAADENGIDGFAGQAYLSLGLLYRSKKRNVMAKDFFGKAMAIFEKIEAKEFLKQSKEALDSLEL